MAKFKKINFKSKKTWKQILVIGLACITLVGAIVGLSALFKKSQETTREITPTYAVGTLTEDGKYQESENSIYTKDAFECQGLICSLDFDSTIKYQLFFYDENNIFVHKTDKLETAFNSEFPIVAKYARVVITPNDDDEIKWYEVNGYKNQLTIKVAKEQEFVSFGKNVLVADDSIPSGKILDHADGVTQVESSGRVTSSLMAVNGDTVVVCLSNLTAQAELLVYDENKEFISGGMILGGTYTNPEIFEASNGKFYFSFDISGMKDVAYYRLNYNPLTVVEVYNR